MDLITKFVQEQHVPMSCRVHEQEKMWSKVASDIRHLCTMIHPDQDVWDDVKGGWLPVEAVKEARREELGFVRSAPLYQKVPRAVPDKKGMKVIPVR